MPAQAPSTYAYPSTGRVLHGLGAVEMLAGECDRLGAERILVLTTRSLRDSPTQAKVIDVLGDRVAHVMSETPQHVPLDAVSALIDRCTEAQVDLVVSLGGGSVIDAAKALAAAIAHGYSDAEQLYAHRIVFTPPETVTQDPFTATPMPHIVVPTTLSAAEYDGIFGMTRNGTKDLYADPRLSPSVIVLDPSMTTATPANLWASSGIRALDHAVEIYLSGQPTPITDATSVHAIQLLLPNLGPSTQNPADMDMRLRCQQASWLSMFGIENVPLGLCHGIGHQLGARCGVPHGVTSCVMLPTVLEAMIDVKPQRMAQLARTMGVAEDGRSEQDLAAALPGRVREFIASLGLPTRLSEVGVTEADFAQIAYDSVHDFVVSAAPLSVNEDDVVRLLTQAS